MFKSKSFYKKQLENNFIIDSIAKIIKEYGAKTYFVFCFSIYFLLGLFLGPTSLFVLISFLVLFTIPFIKVDNPSLIRLLEKPDSDIKDILLKKYEEQGFLLNIQKLLADNYYDLEEAEKEKIKVENKLNKILRENRKNNY